MANCVNHPGRKEAAKVFGKAYCKQCKDGIDAAVKDVDKHVEPKECFVWYAKNDDWEAIDGTGCAHWVMHQLDDKSGAAADKCLAGFGFRVKKVVAKFKGIKDIGEVKVGDVYVNPDKTHMGLVSKVTAAADEGGAPSITIKHDSSARGRVSEDEFAVYFKGKGSFMRP